ncbi:MAG: discoidin domain-containing protein [Candidatus Aenigmarchaeota archaeon]|nr:discoidin domain-containing protein [Candidatus Aenigmarchaeota archaeon]
MKTKDSGSLNFQYMKNLEAASATFAADMMSIYLQQQVVGAGEEGNSVQCEREYIKDSQFRPVYKAIGDCAQQSTISQIKLKTQANADVDEKGAVGYFLCDEYYEPLPDNTSIVLRIKNSAGEVVAEYNSKTSNVMKGIENFNLKNIVLPSVPGRYLFEFSARTDYNSQVIEGNYKYEIDIVSPSIKAALSPKEQCGSGEQLDYMLNISSSIDYPIIYVEKNKYIPFSMPYIAQKKVGYRFETDYLSLKDISPSCDITELVSWNQAEKKFDSLDTNAYIEPGKGYFVKSSNNCAIIFNSERFSGYSRQIKFEQVNDIALIGSVGYSLYPEAISCYSSQLGYKIKDNIAVQDQSARKPIYFIEASPADSPTPPEKIFDQRMNYAERIEPGKAYWVYSAESCSLQSRSSSPPFIGKDIAVNITNNVPEGWSMKQTENMFYNSFTASQFSYVTNSQQAGHDAYSSDLLRIGETMPKEYQITPNPADYLSYKKYNLSINIENIMAYVNSSVDGSYSITKQDPVINITEISRNGKQKEYRLSILNKQNPGCQPKTYYIRVQAPDYWNARITDSRNDKIMAEIEPGSVDESTILVNPRSVSSDINILVTSAGEKDIIRYEDLFDQVMTTRAADLAIGSLYFINPDAQANERIGMMINNSILYPGAVNNIAFGDIVSLSQNKDYLFFIEDRSGSRYLKKMSKTNYNISIVTNTSASIIAASERHAYFYDNNTLFRIRLNDSYITITAFAENITAIESDENNLYFLQANVLKKISSTMQTIGEFEYISDIAVDDKYIYLAVNHSIYGKIIKIDKNSLEISTVAAYPGIDRIAVDERWIYLSAGYEIKRIEKITKTYEQKIRIDVPGHSKPVIVLDNKEGVPGEVVSFPIQVTNTNYNSPESSMNFYIKNVVINNSLSRSYNGFRCYDDSRLISNSMSGIVYLCLNSSIESNFSSSYDFTVVIGTEDQSMDAEVNGKYIIKYQGPPFVQVIGDKIKDSSIFNRETAVIKKGQDAWYDIEITNTEARSNSFGFNVSGIMFQAYDKYRRYPIESISLGYRTYDKKEKISLRLDTGLIDYSGKNYTLSIYNIENPVVHADANLEALITPCNFNNVCNIEDNENSSNCADCISALKCNGECDTTTEKGIEFSVLNKIDGLYVCKKDSANYWCINNSMNNDCGIGKECICKSNSNTCAVSCVDNADYYYLLGRENNTLLQSPFFMFRCPTCLGNIYDDFNQWLLKKKTAHMTADYCAQSSGFTYQTVCTATREQYISCRDSIAFILESAKEINASISSARSGQSDCAGAAAGTAGFMNSMDDIYNDNCRLFQGYGNLRILDIKQNNITIENKGTTDYYGIVSCSYNTQQAGHDADNGNIFSECSQVIAGKQMILNITLSPGIYNLFCAANGSWFDDCRASSEHSSMRTLVDIPYPDTSLQIIDYNYNQDTDDIIVDMRNNGKQGEAFVSCALSSEAYSEARELNTSSTIGMNKIVSLKLSGILPAGTWSIERCSVYYNDALQHTLSLGKRFSIGKPVIKIISPGNKTAVKDTIYIEMAMVSAAAIYIDDNYIGQTDEDRFLINTKQLSNSMHVIAAVECNRHGCSNDSISVYIVNGINENDFVTMPEYRSYSVRKGNEMNISFIIKNIGQFEDSYSIYYDMKPDWVSSTSESDTVIGPGESRMINFYLSVNDSNPALLEFSAYSRTSTQTKKAFVNFTIGDNMPPDIKSASAIPYEVNRGETVAFYADITDDNENNITAIACSDKECNKELCRMSIEQVLGRELYQCSYLVDMEKGLHSFYILANDSNDMTISFGENFFVKEFMQKINSFSIEPYEQNIELIAGERYMVEFALNNTGNQKDRYDISYNIDTWYASLFVDYQRKNSVLLEPGQAVMIGLEIDAPVAEIGEKAILELSVRSASGSMKTGHANMAVNDIINRPPEINELYTMSYANAINQPVVFIASVIDPDNDQITANICSNRMCNELLCAIEAGTCSKIFNSTGIFQYYLVAEDSHGLRTISSAHNFEVKDSTDTGARNIISESIKINSSSYLLQEAPVNVIDDNNSYWTASSLPAWLIIDLNRTTAVTGFGIFSESAARPKGFRIDISENCINYTTAYNTNSGQYKTGWIKQFFSPANGRCVKLYITASESNADYASVALFEVYASTASQATESQQTRANLPEYNDNNASRSDIADYAVQEYNKTDYTLFIIIVIAAIVILAVIFRNSIKQLIGRQRLKNYYDS